MQLTIYSVLHMLVDGCCAFFMFSCFSATAGWFGMILLYNFLAFALQMPIGALMDLLGLNQNGRMARFRNVISAAAGAILCLIGAFLGPVFLGLGNALFHIGGGIDEIREDEGKQKRGQDLGIFVAPGALGLFLGTWFGKGAEKAGPAWFMFSALFLILFVLLFLHIRKEKSDDSEKDVYREEEKTGSAGFLLPVCLCFIVVVLRSYLGLAAEFTWKSGFGLSLLSVLMVVSGKMMGGIFAAHIGRRKTIVLSLLLAAAGYLFSENIIPGLAALFFFNMTMPITLQMIIEKKRELSGFFFGLLTLALFLGFLPVYYGLEAAASTSILGAGVSLVSLLCLLTAEYRKGGRWSCTT